MRFKTGSGLENIAEKILYMYVCMYTYTYIHTYIHTYIYTGSGLENIAEKILGVRAARLLAFAPSQQKLHARLARSASGVSIYGVVLGKQVN